MHETLRRLIADFQERPLFSGIERNIHIPLLQGKTDAVIGMRRSGKTCLCYNTITRLVQDGVSRDRILYLNFEDERLLPLQTGQLALIPEIFFENNPDNKQRQCYFFFDEIQRIPGWELFVRRLMDSEKVHIVVTGSSAKLLGREIATALRGRSLPSEVFPFSFREYLVYHDAMPDNARNPGSTSRARLQKRLSDYLWRGGFPEAQPLDENFRIRLLQGYVDVVLFRDVVERHDSVNVDALRSLIRYSAASVTGHFSINKFYHVLRSAGVSCTKNSLYDYLNLLEDAFFLFSVSIASKSEKTKRVNPRKLYLADSGLISAMTGRIDRDSGVLLENAVFQYLRSSGVGVEYYRTKSGKEINFLVSSTNVDPRLFQVCADMSDTDTRQRELSALAEGMNESGIRTGCVVTLREKERIKMPEGVVNIVPAWELFLSEEK